MRKNLCPKPVKFYSVGFVTFETEAMLNPRKCLFGIKTNVRGIKPIMPGFKIEPFAIKQSHQSKPALRFEQALQVDQFFFGRIKMFDGFDSRAKVIVKSAVAGVGEKVRIEEMDFKTLLSQKVSEDRTFSATEIEADA